MGLASFLAPQLPDASADGLGQFLLQNKELRGRILHLEGSRKPSKEGLLAQMETRLLELEEQLESEERYEEAPPKVPPPGLFSSPIALFRGS